MRHPRRGFTLIESLVVIALTGTTLTVVTVTMHSLHRAEHRLREDQQSQRALEQLAFRLRQDAHGAASATIATTTPARSLTLVTPDEQQIEYLSAGTGIERVVRRGKTVAHRDRFMLAAAADAFWTMDTRFERPVIVFHWPAPTSSPPSAGALRSTRVIQTVVGVARHPARKVRTQ